MAARKENARRRDPEARREYSRRWRERNREAIREKNRRNRKPTTAAKREYMKSYSRDWRLRTRYGITAEQYAALHEAQNGLCAICGEPETATDRSGEIKLRVDHCHTSGDVRALLCHGCNAGLGHFRERPDLMTAAISYLARHAGTAAE